MNQVNEPDVTLSMRSMALAAYDAKIEQAFQLQSRIVLNQLLRAEFGDDALPAWESFRRFINRRDVLAANQEDWEKRAQNDSQQLVRLMAEIKALEDLFRIQKDRDNEAFMAGLRAYWESTKA